METFPQSKLPDPEYDWPSKIMIRCSSISDLPTPLRHHYLKGNQTYHRLSAKRLKCLDQFDPSLDEEFRALPGTHLLTSSLFQLQASYISPLLLSFYMFPLISPNTVLCLLSSENLTNPKKIKRKLNQKKIKRTKEISPIENNHQILWAGTDMEKFPNICLCAFNSLINLFH